ncbi:hypothetical protein BJP34_04275 [Moorena producens PAL-8-15-08-1]|uniref:JmjC domain-containing protein n=1 Tax=Moorena producens PAL-8-15-08-1 TaxID=1458985 RepID=A0A1D8TM97_9CYAN|nr:cupin-like domain-containing protein [Moorena producens]AOW98771.1 hypothetical protein BJP34_04275 [Moorena producens PAL-8-15-08-1]
MNILSSYNIKNKRARVPKVEQLSKEEFYGNYVQKNTPLVICGGVKHWDAIHLWTNEYLEQVVGFNTVDVETSRDQFEGRIFDDAEKVYMPFSRFLERLTLPEGETDYFVGNWLFPALVNNVPDIDLFHAFDVFYKRRMLMTRGGNRIAFHHDWYENLLCQVSGYKKLTLVDIAETAYMYSKDGEEHANYSPIDIHQPDYQQYPLFAQATLYETEIYPGDVLYIPCSWWHTVDSFQRNIALSFSFYEANSELLLVLSKMFQKNAFALSVDDTEALQNIFDNDDNPSQKIKRIKNYAKNHKLSTILLMFNQRNKLLFKR